MILGSLMVPQIMKLPVGFLDASHHATSVRPKKKVDTDVKSPAGDHGRNGS
jgi:hypothetical protein